jgi:Protein of unknown function (DUF3553)
MAHKEGDFVRHRERPEWGVGRISRVSGDNLEIAFQDHVRMLKTAIADPHLDRARADEFQSPTPATPAKRASRAKTAKAAK